MATFVSEEASAINCPACLSPYQVPKLLPCLHTFCQKCLQRCSEELEDKEGKKIKCPLCRSECDVPTGGVDGFLHDLSIPVVSQKESDEVLQCSLCVEKNTAVSQCVECQALICSKCVDIHRTLLLFRSHQMIPLNTSILGDSKLLTFKDVPIFCKEHPSYCRSFFCLTCNELLCAYCVVGGHRDHNIADSLEEASLKIREIFASLSADMDENIADLETYISESKSLEERSGENFDKVRERIESIASDIITEVNHQKEVLIDQLTAKHQTGMKQVWSERNEKEIQLMGMKNSLNYHKRLSTCSQTVFLSLSSELLKPMQEMMKVKSDYRTLKTHIGECPILLTTDRKETKPTIQKLLPSIVDTDHISICTSIPCIQVYQQVNIFVNIDIPRVKQENVEVNANVFITYGDGIILPRASKEQVSLLSWEVKFSPVCGGLHKVTASFNNLLSLSKSFQVMEFSDYAEPHYGTRVVKGPDWKYRERQIPPGTYGIVTRQVNNGMIQVRWSNGISERYRWGMDGCYDVVPAFPPPEKKPEST